MNKRILAVVVICGGVAAFVTLRLINGNSVHKLKDVRQVMQGEGEVAQTSARPETGIWPSWNSNSTAEIIQWLRSSGCPEQFIEDIVIGEINRQTARTIILYRRTSNSVAFASRDDGIAAICSNRTSELARAMGPTILAADGLVGLPYVQRLELASTGSTLADILREKDAKLAKIRAQSHGFVTKEDEEAVKAIEKQAIVDLQNALTPEEFRKYETDQFARSEFGSELVANLGATEEELAAMNEFITAQANHVPPFMAEDPIQQQARLDLVSKLGPERFAQLTLALDPGCREAIAFATRFGLDTKVAEEIAQLRNATLSTFMQIRTAQTDPYQREESSRRLNQSVRSRLTEILGRDAETYIQNAKLADWAR